MVKRKATILLLASSLLMLPAAAAAQSNKSAGVTTTAGKGQTVNAGQLIERYSASAGSPANAKSLVNGLRTKTEITLVGASTKTVCTPKGCTSGGTEMVTFYPPTDPMGWGNVDIALALMEADVKANNVTTFTPQHIKAALLGGSVGSITFKGVLKLRAEGNGWGEVAKSLEFQLN
jgi:hypothetical protein